MPEPSKKYCTDGKKSIREENTSHLQTPGTNASFGQPNMYGNFMATPSIISPMYDYNSLNLPYIYSGGNSPHIPYMQYPSQSPIAMRNDPNEVFIGE